MDFFLEFSSAKTEYFANKTVIKVMAFEKIQEFIRSAAPAGIFIKVTIDIDVGFSRIFKKSV